jgi:hypothetical protein
LKVKLDCLALIVLAAYTEEDVSPTEHAHFFGVEVVGMDDHLEKTKEIRKY